MQSVRTIQRLAREESSHPIVRRTTERLSLYTAPYDHETRLARVRRFLIDHFQFHPDPYGTELVKSPAYHVQAIEHEGLTLGDCDDAACLGSSMALSVGRPARLHVASYRPDRSLHHIFAEAHDGRDWIDLDPFRHERWTKLPTRSVIVGV